MSHKTTIKLVKLNPKPLAKSVFKTKTLRVEDESDATQINAAVRKAAVEKAERALLDEELAKPSAARNPALMRKYGTVDIAGAVDAYPDLDKGGKFHIVATVPDDPDIPLEHRPTPWSVTIVINHEGNQFDFVFPFSRAIGVPTAAFKLDRYDVYLDSNHNVVMEPMPDYSIYEALLDYKNNDEEYIKLRNAVFKKLGVLKNGKLDFRIKGVGFLVKSTRLKVTGVIASKSTTENTKKDVEVKTSDVKMVKVVIHDVVEYNNNESQARKLADMVRAGDMYPLLGVSTTAVLPTIYIDEVYASSKLSTPTIVLNDFINGDVWGIVISGPTSVAELVGRKKPDSRFVNAWVIKKNREVLAKYEKSIAQSSTQLP
jgi:hypothetical protein